MMVRRWKLTTRATPRQHLLTIVFRGDGSAGVGETSYEDVHSEPDGELLRLYLRDEAGTLTFFFEDVGLVSGPHDRHIAQLERALHVLPMHFPELRVQSLEAAGGSEDQAAR